MRWSQIQWIWQVDPDRFTDHNVFFSYDWSDDDDANWLAAHPDHETMQTTLDELNAQIPAHPDLARFVEFSGADRRTTEHIAFAEGFGAQIEADRSAIAACF